MENTIDGEIMPIQANMSKRNKLLQGNYNKHLNRIVLRDRVRSQITIG